jgi:hypothetical protein
MLHYLCVSALVINRAGVVNARHRNRFDLGQTWCSGMPPHQPAAAVRCASYSADFSNLQPENDDLPKLMQAKHDGLAGPFAYTVVHKRLISGLLLVIRLVLISILANNSPCCNVTG